MQTGSSFRDGHTVHMIKCCVCKSNSAFQVIRFKRKGYSIWHCQYCNVMFSIPMRAPDLNFYSQATDSASSARHSTMSAWPSSHPTQKSNILRCVGPLELLDVGCGNGAFSAFADSLGFNVTGIDTDSLSLSVADKRRLRNTIFLNCDLFDFPNDPISSKQFDIITMFEVFEHLDNPVAAIRQIKSLLKEKGWYIGSIPNRKRLLFWKAHMPYEVPPYHLTFWTMSCWASFLERNGFRVRKIIPNIYFGYITDVIIHRLTIYHRGFTFRLLPLLLLRQLEAIYESLFPVGASIYFEAQKQD